MGVGIQAEKEKCMDKFERLNGDLRTFCLDPSGQSHRNVIEANSNLREGEDCNIQDQKFLNKVDHIMEKRLLTTGELGMPEETYES